VALKGALCDEIEYQWARTLARTERLVLACWDLNHTRRTGCAAREIPRGPQSTLLPDATAIDSGRVSRAGGAGLRCTVQYCHVDYNSKTAQLYTDLGLLTTAVLIWRDVSDRFAVS